MGADEADKAGGHYAPHRRERQNGGPSATPTTGNSCGSGAVSSSVERSEAHQEDAPAAVPTGTVEAPTVTDFGDDSLDEEADDDKHHSDGDDESEETAAAGGDEDGASASKGNSVSAMGADEADKERCAPHRSTADGDCSRPPRPPARPPIRRRPRLNDYDGIYTAIFIVAVLVLFVRYVIIELLLFVWNFPLHAFNWYYGFKGPYKLSGHVYIV
eukprot:Selendium_serpulae@DN418_c0_g1_i1.p1